MKFNEIRNQTINYAVERRHEKLIAIRRINNLFDSIENDSKFKDLLICQNDNHGHRLMEKFGVQIKENEDYFISEEHEIETIKKFILQKYQYTKDRLEKENITFMGLQRIFIKSGIVNPRDFTWWRSYILHFRFQI